MDEAWETENKMFIFLLPGAMASQSVSQFHTVVCRSPVCVTVTAQTPHSNRSTFSLNVPEMEPTATALTKGNLTAKPPGSHAVVLLIKEATFVLSNTTQVYLTNLNVPPVPSTHICGGACSLNLGPSAGTAVPEQIQQTNTLLLRFSLFVEFKM